MILQKIQAAVSEARGKDDAVAEFEALQDVIAALALRSHGSVRVWTEESSTTGTWSV